eukprot:5395592-Pleurochrysis_carterae.AAC.1
MHAPAAPPIAPARSARVRAARLWLLSLQGRLRQGVRAPVPDAAGPGPEAPRRRHGLTASPPAAAGPCIGARTRAASHGAHGRQARVARALRRRPTPFGRCLLEPASPRRRRLAHRGAVRLPPVAAVGACALLSQVCPLLRYAHRAAAPQLLPSCSRPRVRRAVASLGTVLGVRPCHYNPDCS